MFRKFILPLNQVYFSKRFVQNKINYNCWSCTRLLTENEKKKFFCPCDSRVILPVHPERNFFHLFGIEINYNVEESKLTKNFRNLMKKLHPDLFTLKSEKEKEYSADQASLLNKAYKILLNPIERGMYMLELENINFEKESYNLAQTDEEKNKLLFEILELNELIDEINQVEQVHSLEKRVAKIIQPFEKELEQALKSNNYKYAVKIIANMKYYQNVYERLINLKLKFELIDF